MNLTALQRIKDQDPDKLDEQGFCSKERSRCGQCGFDGKFLLKVFRIAWEMMSEANSHGNDNLWDYPEKEFEERMSK